jgi:hypothetical protein
MDFIQSDPFPDSTMNSSSILPPLFACMLLPAVSRGSLVSIYEFNESGGTVAADTIRGAGGTGAVNGGSSFVAGKIGNAVEFDGSTGWALAPNAIPSGTTAFTISAWVWADAANTWGSIVKNWGGSSAGAFHFGLDNASGRLSNYVSGPAVGPVLSPGTLGLNAWHHVAVTYDGGSASQILYIDGLQVATGVASASLNALGSNMGIGVKTENSTLSPDPSSPGWWDGKIDDLAIWNHVLTGAEILQIKTNGDNGIGVVPEPASAAFLALGLLGLLRRHR